VALDLGARRPTKTLFRFISADDGDTCGRHHLAGGITDVLSSPLPKLLRGTLDLDSPDQTMSASCHSSLPRAAFEIGLD
jgi:hypothetical protein